ncbi:dihydrofolate reductase family protein [Dactylosporangium fulvum]|uniref:Dihydrofolate reductase family protein n=1 Tax=Dactylosporangium fulvum TaxID=53359 RepID=A0ABY5WB02_9ACTN|nr:dihydrofolate reductase family protein [Dactylosporangium fulvum]UWP86466.1 dihydrofolate reductase family protein [Dactylosporangium fulvum]
MGKVVITAQMSADASIGPSIGWYKPGGEHEAAGEDEVRLADAMLLGRKTYAALAPIWSATTGAFADRVNSLPKYVASTSPTGPLDWNATLVKGDLVEEVRRLKAHHEGNLLTYGCGEFAYNLVRHGLVDEIHFWVHPVVWSEEARPFHGLGHIRMKLKDATVFGNGVVLHNYEPL